jgi:hypothetical protein
VSQLQTGHAKAFGDMIVIDIVAVFAAVDPLSREPWVQTLGCIERKVRLDASTEMAEDGG